MLLAQVFKTSEGARKRAAFENNHCGGRFYYHTVRCIGPDSREDMTEFDPAKLSQYTWRLARKIKGAA